MRRARTLLLYALCIGGLICSVNNVYSDNADVLRMAQQTACDGQGTGCRAQMTRLARSPISQTFDLVTPQRTVTVRCVRSLYLVGSYSCSVE
jgi:hypothetical protein